MPHDPEPIPPERQSTQTPVSVYDARVAVYGTPGEAPRFFRVDGATQAQLLEAVTARTLSLLNDLHGTVPAGAVREVIDNLAHARCDGVVVTIFEQGSAVRVSDRGPGVPDKDRAVLPGYTTAGRPEREILRGVGAGLAVALEALTQVGGTLELEDNLGGGTVVTLRVPRSKATVPASRSGEAPQEALTERQLKALLLIVELGPVGPTRIARELTIATSTAFRDLLVLHQRGYVDVDDEGRRSATEAGLLYLQTVL